MKNLLDLNQRNILMYMKVYFDSFLKNIKKGKIKMTNSDRTVINGMISNPYAGINIILSEIFNKAPNIVPKETILTLFET